eukprot:gnl/MRDRNA2_/MRDRNA2_568645_c0_seq1.p1 gnl/MRDRNA2_/MRDRNA2_568645_c0~~gnl/MRDRNA2_/MRDRNA2_568645_c0_seq1.p1  ORF type:complete len:185 (+),score=23.28 gnl/MRDRNA2_/MRDRNA2_568645_c0_seq1:3-557(+)
MGTQDIILILTNGLFLQLNVLEALLVAAEVQPTFLPILTDESFRFPTEDNVSGPPLVALEKFHDCRIRKKLLKIIRKCFREIAIVFQPQLYSSTETIIATKAVEISTRLLKSNRSRIRLSTTTDEGVPCITEEAQLESSAAASLSAALSKSGPSDSAGDKINSADDDRPVHVPPSSGFPEITEL